MTTPTGESHDVDTSHGPALPVLRFNIGQPIGFNGVFAPNTDFCNRVANPGHAAHHIRKVAWTTPDVRQGRENKTVAIDEVTPSANEFNYLHRPQYNGLGLEIIYAAGFENIRVRLSGRPLAVKSGEVIEVTTYCSSYGERHDRYALTYILSDDEDDDHSADSARIGHHHLAHDHRHSALESRLTALETPPAPAPKGKK